jgi:hypothetical protein
MQTDSTILRQFHDKEAMLDFCGLLRENDVAFYVDDNSQRFDVTFANNEARRFYIVRVAREDLEKARTVADDHDREVIDALPADYYLFDFSATELMELLNRQDEWSDFDIALARRRLAEMDIVIDDADVERMKEERMEVLKEPDPEPVLAIVCGYVFSVLGGVFGLIIALFLLTSKKTLPTGERQPLYSPATQRHGWYMLLIFAASIILTVLYILSEL